MREVGFKEIKERKEKAPKGRPKKISVFSKKSLLYSRRFENQCSTYEKVLPYAPADVDQLTWWKIHQVFFGVAGNGKGRLQKKIVLFSRVLTLREEIKTIKTFQFGHCPNLGGGVYPCPNFFATFFY